MKTVPPGMFVTFVVPVSTTELQFCSLLNQHGLPITIDRISIRDSGPDRPTTGILVSFPNELLVDVLNNLLAYRRVKIDGETIRCQSVRKNQPWRPAIRTLRPLTPAA